MHVSISFPLPKVTLVLTFTLLAGFSKHSQLSFFTFFNSKTSITTLVSSFLPIILVVNTFVLFKTYVSHRFM